MCIIEYQAAMMLMCVCVLMCIIEYQAAMILMCVCVNVYYRVPGCHDVDVCLLIRVTEHQAAMVAMRKDYNQQVDKLQVSFFLI